MRENAQAAGGVLILLGLALFALMTAIVVFVLRTGVARPIEQMKHASELVAAGDYRAVADGETDLPDQRDDEIGHLARSFRAMAARVGHASRNLEQMVAARTVELQVANRRLEQLSLRDSLTGAYNRRAFDIDLASAVADARAGEQPFALVLCDIDHFKRYNDSYGHDRGDRALSRIAGAMARAVPAGRLYRYGGEEIALILDIFSDTDCRAEAERLIRAVEELALPHRASPYGIVTASAGLAIYTPDMEIPRDIIQAADALLYRAKADGRNQLADARNDASPLAGAA